jgi:hypothetical protein
MGDHDFGVLLQAVDWIEQHARLDAPDYPLLEELSSVVNNIAKRREPGSPYQRRPDSPGVKMVVYLIGSTSEGEAYS